MSDDAKNPLLQELESIRDRVRLQMHLASMDAKDEWSKLETRFDEVRREVEKAAGEAEETVETTVNRVTDELKSRYEQLASMIRGDGEEGP